MFLTIYLVSMVIILVAIYATGSEDALNEGLGFLIPFIPVFNTLVVVMLFVYLVRSNNKWKKPTIQETKK